MRPVHARVVVPFETCDTCAREPVRLAFVISISPTELERLSAPAPRFRSLWSAALVHLERPVVVVQLLRIFHAAEEAGRAAPGRDGGLTAAEALHPNAAELDLNVQSGPGEQRMRRGDRSRCHRYAGRPKACLPGTSRLLRPARSGCVAGLPCGRAVSDGQARGRRGAGGGNRQKRAGRQGRKADGQIPHKAVAGAKEFAFDMGLPPCPVSDDHGKARISASPSRKRAMSTIFPHSPKIQMHLADARPIGPGDARGLEIQYRSDCPRRSAWRRDARNPAARWRHSQTGPDLHR